MISLYTLFVFLSIFFLISSSSKESLGYPTQKPEALLDRIIKASSNENDLVAFSIINGGMVCSKHQDINAIIIQPNTIKLLRLFENIDIHGDHYKAFFAHINNLYPTLRFSHYNLSNGTFNFWRKF